MSTNIFDNKTTSKGKKTITPAIVIIILGVVGISIISYFLGQKHANESKSPIPIVDLSINNQNQRILGQQIYNWTGKISQIEESKIILSTNIKNYDGSYSPKDITAIIDENTKITKWDLTKPQNGNQLNSKTTISFGNLTAGNEIIIKSNNNINAYNEILATDISLLITPK